MEAIPSFTHLSDTEPTAAVARFAHDERQATVQLIASLAEFDRRRLYLDHGFTSLYKYCVEVLHLSEHAAYGRIEAARAARQFPCVLALLQDGRLSLTSLCLLGRHLTLENHLELLEEATHKGKDDVKRIIARLHPQPDAPSAIRKLPTPATARTTATTAPAGPACAPVSFGDVVPQMHVADESSALLVPAPVIPRAPRPAVIAPLSPERYKIQITVDRETHDVLRQAQNLMRHSIPSGDPAAIVARALRLLVADLLKKKAGATERPGRSRGLDAGSRVIPAAVKREVWTRDAGQCAFVGSRGRCAERGHLEYHHVIPYAMGGETTADNIELRCRTHNAHEARLAGLPLGPDVTSKTMPNR